MRVSFRLVVAACSASAARASTLQTAYETILPDHVSELMALYLRPEFNQKWNQRMSEQIFLNDSLHGEVRACISASHSPIMLPHRR